MSPLFCGIGLENYQAVAHFKWRLHTEYIVQLAENGIIGFILYICFYVNIIKRCVKYVHDRFVGSYIWVIMGGIISILFIALTAWTYSMSFYYACLGCAIAFTDEGFVEQKELESYENCDC